MPKGPRPSIPRMVQGRALPGLLLFDPHGKLLFSNLSARQILHPGRDTAMLQPIRSYLRNLTDTYIKPKSSVSSPPVRHLQTTFSSGRRTYAVQVCVLARPPTGRSRMVAVFLERINPSRFDLHKAQRVFKLSHRESEVIRALQLGRTDKEIASVLGISSETVRGYLKSIRSKLAVSTRTAIINKLQSNLIAFFSGTFSYFNLVD